MLPDAGCLTRLGWTRSKKRSSWCPRCTHAWRVATAWAPASRPLARVYQEDICARVLQEEEAKRERYRLQKLRVALLLHDGEKQK